MLTRRVVVWQSQNQTWNIAGYDFYYINRDDENFDHEWDVEYTDDFNFVSIGHETSEDAEAAWEGANHGGAEVYEWSQENAKDCELLDQKAAAYLKHEQEQIKSAFASYGQRVGR